MNNISFIIALRLFYQSTKTMPNNRKIYFEKKIISKNENLKKIKGHKIIVKREDKIDKCIFGNKFRKLKYIFLKLNKDKTNKVLSFGAAFSNHLGALAKARNLYRFKTIGIFNMIKKINGNEKKHISNKFRRITRS